MPAIPFAASPLAPTFPYSNPLLSLGDRTPQPLSCPRLHSRHAFLSPFIPTKSVRSESCSSSRHRGHFNFFHLLTDENPYHFFMASSLPPAQPWGHTSSLPPGPCVEDTLPSPFILFPCRPCPSLPHLHHVSSLISSVSLPFQQSKHVLRVLRV